MDLKNRSFGKTGPNRVPSPSLARSPSLIRYNTSPDIHRRVMEFAGSQVSPPAQHQIYGHSFRERILSSSSPPDVVAHPLAGFPGEKTDDRNSVPSPSNYRPSQPFPPSVPPGHLRTDTEMDWLYDRNAELELELDKLAHQVKVQNMVARNEGRRAAAKIDALEAALLDMERQNAKLVAEGKRARIKEKREAGSGGPRLGLRMGYGHGQRYERGNAAPLVEDSTSIGTSGRSATTPHRSPSPDEGSRATLLPRRRSMGGDGRTLATELGLSDGPASFESVGGGGNSCTPPVNDIPLVEVPQEEESSQESAPLSSSQLAPDHAVSPDRAPSHTASDVSGLPLRASTYLTPSQSEGLPYGSLYSPKSFPTSRLGVRNRSRLFPPSTGSSSPKFQVWASPGSPYRSPGSTIGIASRFSGGRKTLASELASWAMDMDEDETLEVEENEAVLHEAQGGEEDWQTTRLGRYSLLEKKTLMAVPEQETEQSNDTTNTTTTTTTTETGAASSGSWVGRIFQRIKRFYQSTWLEIQFIWVVLIFLRRVWIEGRQGLILRSKIRDNKTA